MKDLFSNKENINEKSSKNESKKRKKSIDERMRNEDSKVRYDGDEREMF